MIFHISHLLQHQDTLPKPIVHAHGVFDILHIGHIRYLNEAKKLGKTLIVTITPDKYVNKGPGRPVFTEQLRAEAINALSCVDYVAINTSRTAVEAIRGIRPQFYAKGGEYRYNATLALLEEEEAVRDTGGQLVYLSNDEWHSSNLVNSTNTFLYIRGEPGAGKITVARILEQSLKWQLFWLHDLDGICKIVGDHRVPRLMDDVTKPILQHLFQQEKNVIYVRPSRDQQTVDRVRALAINAGYRFILVHLTADQEVLVSRVENRPKTACRISTKAGLVEYLTSRKPAEIPGEHVIDTTSMTPTGVADQITKIVLCRL